MNKAIRARIRIAMITLNFFEVVFCSSINQGFKYGFPANIKNFDSPPPAPPPRGRGKTDSGPSPKGEGKDRLRPLPLGGGVRGGVIEF